MTRRLLALFAFITLVLACRSTPSDTVGLPLSGFPTTTTPTLSNSEFYPPIVATAVNKLAASTIADLTTLNTLVAATGKARCVVIALPATYTGTGTGTLTATANTAIAAQHGVTPVAGDVVWLAAGGTNVTAADAGPMTVTAAGGSSPYILTRPNWWSHGSVIPVGSEVLIGGEDTLFGGTGWYTFAAKGALVDAVDPQGYPDEVAVQVTLVAGAATINTVPLRSASLSVVIPTLSATGGTVTTTVGYQPFAITPGVLGTGSVAIKAVAAGLTTQTGDTSVLNVFLTN